MSQMNTLVCNKCFTPLYRGKRPYHITQCGHISCQACLQQFEKQCPQCQRVDTISLALEEPLISEVIPFFTPFTETMEMLSKVDTFRTDQLKITMQRFYELDKKYEILKTRYWIAQRNLKALTEKFVSLKNENDNLEKKLLVFQMNRETPRSRVIETQTTNVGISDQSASLINRAGYFLESSSDFVKSANVTPMRSPEKKFYRTVDGFRIPMNRKPPRSHRSSNMLP